MKAKIHKRNLRLFNNAGMAFPECQADVELLDTNKSSWPTTPRDSEVTCKICLSIIRSKHGK